MRGIADFRPELPRAAAPVRVRVHSEDPAAGGAQHLNRHQADDAESDDGDGLGETRGDQPQPLQRNGRERGKNGRAVGHALGNERAQVSRNPHDLRVRSVGRDAIPR